MSASVELPADPPARPKGGLPRVPDGARYLARAVRIAAGDGRADARIERLLGYAARTAGAVDVAVAIDQTKERVLVWRNGRDGAGGGRALADWLDRCLPPRPGRGRTRSSALLVGVSGEDGAGADPGPANADPGNAGLHRSITLPGKPVAAMAFSFRSARAEGASELRFPLPFARATTDLVAALVRHLDETRDLDQLRHADAERRRFVTVVAHELRTPLASLAGYLDLLETDASGEFLDRSRDLVTGMATLVADLLELSRLEAGQLHLAPAPFSGAEAAQAAVRDVTPLALERGILLDTALPARLRTVHADRRRVQQVLVNLLANAIKFSPPSSRVGISLRFDGPAALYTVRDEGPGVAPEERAMIFEPFHRAAGAERVVGTGLGLPIARDLARRMGGDLEVTSAPGCGSTFVVALPATKDADRAAVLGALGRALDAERPVTAPS
ncbi:MAG TPA: HAMP domain-containing sensor histidine kinase [Candidatus Acidoferrales bacterium]|nr:HAMP domain-containing sensor histidine kinase [Candidatus Acidoferrales bacterium]